VEEFSRVSGIVCRYVIAALACWWFFWFLALIGQTADRSQELAGMAFAKAVICGVAAAIWFYRAGKAKQVQKPVVSAVKAIQPLAQVQPDVPFSPNSTDETPVIVPPEPALEAHPLKIDQPVQPKDSTSERAWAFFGVAGVICIGLITGVAIYSRDSKSKTENSLDIALSSHKSVKPTNLIDDALASQKSEPTSVAPCPAALPSGVSSKALNAADLSKIVGTNGILTSEQSYDSLYSPNGTAWNATLSYENMTASCITVATVELELTHAGNASKERHSIVLTPICC
jgi:type IV secretory pathway VirB10-like protein